MSDNLEFTIGSKDSDKWQTPEAEAIDGIPKNGDEGSSYEHKHKHTKRSKKEHGSSGVLQKITRRSKHSSKPKSQQPLNVPSLVLTNTEGSDQHVMFVLGEHAEDQDEKRQPPAFVELDELCADHQPPEWREVARWIKFEEEVEESADRWSKPHVAIQSLMSLFEVRSCLAKAAMLLDLEVTSLELVADELVDRMVKKKMLEPGLKEQTRELLLLHHSTLYTRQKRHAKSGQQLHIIRSLAEIGKRHSAKDVNKMSSVPSRSMIKSATNLGVDRMVPPQTAPSADTLGVGAQATSHSPDNDPNGIHQTKEEVKDEQKEELKEEFKDDPPYCKEYDHHFFKKVPHGAEAVNILVGETNFLKHPIAAFVRLKEACRLGEMTEVPVPTRFMFVLLGTTGNGPKYQQIGRAMGTLFSDEMFLDFATRSKSRNDLLAGIDEFLSASSLLPPGQWDPKTRIEPPQSIPTQENRKVLAAHQTNGLDGQKLVHHSHRHQHSQDVMDARGESPTVKLAATASGGGGGGGGNDPDPLKDLNSLESGDSPASPESVEEVDRNANPALMRTGRLFGGLFADIKRRAPFYLSDFKDGIHIQCFASFFFLYFACLTPIITFGGLLSQATGGYLGTMESIVSGAVVGIMYALFAGQPLTIMGSTGPVLVFESIVYRLCVSNRWYYLSFRLWIGIWVSVILFIMVMFDLSALVRFITRFTEESFALLIALIFILEAFKKTYAISKKYPVNFDWKPFTSPPIDCRCVRPSNFSDSEFLKEAKEKYPILELPFVGTNDTDAHHHLNENGTIDWDRLNSEYYTWESMETQDRCARLGGTWNDAACKGFYAPDVFFFCVIIFISCFLLAFGLRSLRNSRFFPNRVRSLIADFAVMIAIVVCTLVDYFLGLQTPKLIVPVTFEPTLGFNKRGWIVPPFNGNPWWSSLVAAGPALLAVILIFMDQQITAVIVNRRENKMKKGAGYHLDLLVLTLTIAINSVLGIPWFVAATVLSINHVVSLKKESESAAPGERPTFLGCREQRVTGFLIFLLIGLSVFMSNLLRRIPMAVLYGVFLLMGITSVNGLQLIQRMGLLFMPAKYQPDYPYLRNVRLWRVHLFTVIQATCLILLYAIKSIKQISILFPLMVLAMCFVRKALDFVFTQEELHWLDDILPESSCSKKRKSTPATGPGMRNPSTNDFSSKLTIDSLPMSEPLLVKADGKPFSVSEEVSKTLIWRQLSGIGLVNHGGDDDDDEKLSRRQRRKQAKAEKNRRRHGHHHGGNASHSEDTGAGSESDKGAGGRKPRFRALRLFSNDFDGTIGRDIAVLFHNTPSTAEEQTSTKPAVVLTTDHASVNESECVDTSQQPAGPSYQELAAPEIKINPPSNQGSPTSSRRQSKL